MYGIKRILIFLTAAFTFTSLSLSAQEQDKAQSKAYIEQAQLMMDAGSLALEEIRDVMVQAAEFDTTSIKANFEAGRLYIETINKDLATKYFMRVYRQKPDYRFDLEYWIGWSYQYGLRFDKAIEYFTKYKARLAAKPNGVDAEFPPIKSVERHIYECETGKELVADPKNFSIVNIGREINSEFDDYGPVLNEAETEMVFTTRRREGNMNDNVDRDNKPWEDIFFSKKTGDKWSPARNLGSPVGTPNHESTSAMSPDGDILFIYKDENGGDIFSSQQKPDGSWSEPEPLPGIINSSYQESSVSITKDQKVLYFASERPGGLGGSDIYVVTKDAKGAWSKVKNMGPVINTEYDEEGPFIDYEGKTFYFSSKGRKGMGGYDIFKSTFDVAKNEWSEPENLGYPINTSDDDVFFTSSKDGKRGYYSSIREDGMGYSDIYKIDILPGKPKAPETAAKKEALPLKFSVKVFDAATKSPLDSKVQLTSVKDNLVVMGVNTRAGSYEFSITAEDTRDYRLSVERDGYIFQNITVYLPGASEVAKTLNRTVELKKIAVGVTSVLHNIYFDFNKATLKEESYAELSKLEKMLRTSAQTRVEIAGHTDSFGPDNYNEKLSLQRANAVKTFLSGKGIDVKRIEAKGYGDTKPLVSNDDEQQGREINRRVEFKIIGK